MKTQLRYFLLALALAAAALLVQPRTAPAQAAAGEDPALVALLAEVITQQKTLQENQNKIDVQLAAIGEEVRQSRLFAARGGRGK